MDEEQLMDPLAIYNISSLLLTNIQAVYVEYGISLPARQYITVGGQGETVHDSEQVTVSWEQAYSGLPGAQSLTPVNRDKPRSAVFVSEVVRTIPGLSPQAKPPKMEDITLASKTQMTDAQLLMEAGLRTAESGWFEYGIVDVSGGVPKGNLQAIILSLVAVI